MKRFACLLLLPALLFSSLAHAAEGKETKRSWKDRGKDLVGFVLSSPDAANPRPGLQEGVRDLVGEYKEQLKEEGRAYAREMGDILVERIRQDPKISSSLTTVQVLCWVVIAYLTLVTLFMVAAVRGIRRDYARLLSLLEKRATER